VQGRWLEWLVAQEIWRRAAIRGDEIPDQLLYWRGGDHELDFVVTPELFVEVKRGRTSPVEYAWFPRRFPHAKLIVVGRDSFETDAITGMRFEQFLQSSVWG
jgi:predicted AAA+ superfamily ATPase